MFYIVTLWISFSIITRDVEEFISYTTGGKKLNYAENAVCIRKGNVLKSQISLQNAHHQVITAGDQHSNSPLHDEFIELTDDEIAENDAVTNGAIFLHSLSVKKSKPILINTQTKKIICPFIRKDDQKVSNIAIQQQVDHIKSLNKRRE